MSAHSSSFLRSKSSQKEKVPVLDHFRKPIHPRTPSPAAAGQGEEGGVYEAYTLPHPVWSEEELNSVQITHTPPEKTVDRVCEMCVCVSVSRLY